MYMTCSLQICCQILKNVKYLIDKRMYLFTSFSTIVTVYKKISEFGNGLSTGIA